MDIDKLKLLITKTENSKLEFKEQWYHKSQKNEMIKDIIALTNGNPQTVGEIGYLIIGVEDTTKKIKEVELLESVAKLEQTVLQNINNYATPPLTDISFDLFIVNEKKILVVSIPSHNYLISLSKDLQTKNRTEKRGVTFYRERDIVAIASPDIIREFDKKYLLLDKYEIKSDRDDIVEIDGLMYQNDILTLDYTYDEAINYSKKLRLGGYDDWRLPTVEELLILATDLEIRSGYKKAYIRGEFAKNILGKYSPNFWTSDDKEEEIKSSSFFGLKQEVILLSRARVINYNQKKSLFDNLLQSLVSYQNKNSRNYVICVRDKESKEIY